MESSDVTQKVLGILKNDKSIIEKYNIFYNGSYIIASYKGVREYRTGVDNTLIILPLFYDTNDIIKISTKYIWNSDIYNFFIFMTDKKLYIFSRDILLEDINKGTLKPSLYTDGYMLSAPYLNDRSTRIVNL